MRAQKLTPPKKIKENVMHLIRTKRLCMKNPRIFLVQKFCISLAAVFMVVISMIIAVLLVNFLVKTELLAFYTFGMRGLKVILFSIPYKYIFLFFISAAAAIFVFKKIDYSWRKNISVHAMSWSFLVLIIFLGSFSAVFGTDNFLSRMVSPKVARSEAVWGKVQKVSTNSITVEEVGGGVVKIVFDDPVPWTKSIEGKYIRAVGEREAASSGHVPHFYAAEAECVSK